MDHCNISNNNALNNNFGILSSSGNFTIISDNTISNNTIYGNGQTGLYITLSSDNNTCTDNTIHSNTRHGVYLLESSNNTFIRNNISDTGGGFYDYRIMSKSTDTTIIDNINRSNLYKIETFIPYLIFQRTTDVDYTIGFSLASIIIERSPLSGEISNITVDSGIIDWLNVTAGLNAGQQYELQDNAGNQLEVQTATSSGYANFTIDLTTGTYKVVSESVSFTPPTPESLTNTTGNFWVNYSWSEGSGGKITDSYNVSINGSWTNATSLTYNNNTVGPHGYAEIIVYAFNNSGSGTLSAGYLTDNVAVPNNPIDITNTSDRTVNENENVYVDFDYTDIDTDSGTFSCNRNDLFSDFDTTTGKGIWSTDYSSAGTYYVNFGVSDGYGSTDIYTMKITVNDVSYPPPVISNVNNGTASNNSVTIYWDTDIPSDSLVKYGTTEDISSSCFLSYWQALWLRSW